VEKKMNYTPKSGLNVPVITVLDDSGRVIADEQRRVIRHVVQNGYGADVVFGVGTTGEWNRIANAERQRIMEIEVDEVRRINAVRRGSRMEDRRSKIERRTAYAILDPPSSILETS
jgi:dihydrodipicolinate synthase/N-acetylneuraminate lyase